LGINLNTVGDDGCAYDASVYDGISLCVRGTETVSLRITTNATVPTTRGGQCAENCDDHFALDITLSDSWECLQIAWGDLSQEGWGTAATFDPAEIIGIQLQFAAATAFTLYVDDLAFWSGGGSAGGAGGGSAGGAGGGSAGGATGVAGSAGSGGVPAAGAGGVSVAGSAGSPVAGAGGASTAGTAGAVATAGAGGATGSSAGTSAGGAGGAAGGA
jgi:hypothetical protein